MDLHMVYMNMVMVGSSGDLLYRMHMNVPRVFDPILQIETSS